MKSLIHIRVKIHFYSLGITYPEHLPRKIQNEYCMNENVVVNYNWGLCLQSEQYRIAAELHIWVADTGQLWKAPSSPS